MNKKYWCVKYYVGGFESVIFMCGDPDEVYAYVHEFIGDAVIIKEIDERLAKSMFNLGFKIYYIPVSKIIPTEPEKPQNKV